MFFAETNRLFFREMIVDDADSAYLLNADPEVIQYTGDIAFDNVEAAKRFLENYDHYKKYGFGRWALILKSNKEYIGWCGLKYLEDADKYDVGYRLMKKYWNQGYATESALKSLDLGFNQFNMNEIVAHADIENKASIRVLEKIGLQFDRIYYENERKCAAYRITKQEYEELKIKD